MKSKNLKLAIPLILTIGLLIGAAFAFQPFAAQSEPAEEPSAILLPEWADVELTDALTGEVFRIADYTGKPILIESFAVWCSNCLRQQREMVRLIDMVGDAVVHISLDTDPNEDLDKVRDHAQRHGFDWLYAIAPIEMTQGLIDEFGLTVVNAPRAPVILIEADGSFRLLPNGIKSAETLLEEIGELPSEGEETT
jgi:cytochrome oxidase Cu insertion factor (SCO1/SenC/PrrC family)